MKKVLIIDTSILCVFLKVPNMETCGSNDDKWDFNRVDKYIKKEIKKKTTLVLPLATLVETGNHIAQAGEKRYEIALSLAEIIAAAADGKTPWAAFTEQSSLWDIEELKKLAAEWPNLAKQKISIGDATIKTVAEYYAKINWQVEILTGDGGLKAYEPSTPPPIPRRRRK